MAERTGPIFAQGRARRGWTVTEVAEAAGISLVALERFEAGRADLLPAEIDRLQRVLARQELPVEPPRPPRRRRRGEGIRW